MKESGTDQINKLLDSGVRILRFPSRLENEYIQHYIESEHIISIPRYTFGFIIFLLFSVLDYYVFPFDKAVAAWGFRAATVLIALAITVLGMKYRYTKTGFLFGASVVLAVFAAEVAIDHIGMVAAGYRMPLGSLFVIVYFCTIMSFPFLYSLYVVLIMIFIQLAGIIYFSGLHAGEIINTLLFYLFIPIMLLASVYLKDADKRKIFLLNMLRQKYEKSKLNESDAEKIISELENLMIKDCPWFDSELSMNDVAKAISVSRHQLTQAINEKLGINFNNYINGFRIRYIIEEMQKSGEKGDERKVLELAFSAGFNSKATFNRIFKEMTGLTPSQYRRKI